MSEHTISSCSQYIPYRVGQGFDIHRLVPHRKLWIGGVEIPCPLGCEAHSDGDVLLHALIDALLGACALGDIGNHFPPSNPDFKDRESRFFIPPILALIKKQGYKIGNIDSTIFLEIPKLYPYKKNIQESLALLVDCPQSNISIKAKTAEKFPPVGTKEAIAASVTVLLVHTL